MGALHQHPPPLLHHRPLLHQVTTCKMRENKNLSQPLGNPGVSEHPQGAAGGAAGLAGPGGRPQAVQVRGQAVLILLQVSRGCTM